MKLTGHNRTERCCLNRMPRSYAARHKVFNVAVTLQTVYYHINMLFESQIAESRNYIDARAPHLFT